MTSTPAITLTAFGKTDVGLVREHNEDNFLIADVSRGVRLADGKEPLSIPLGAKGALLLVCDGMGGAAAGEVASQMAVDSIAGTLEATESPARDVFARQLRRAIEEANDKIYAQSRDNQSERGMGTTCTAVGLVDGTLIVGQIGDSRCYVLRAGRLAQVTKDQSLAWQLMEAGAMTPEEAKGFEHANIILQALGVQERVEVVLSQVDLRRGDVVLVSSDGLHGPVSDEEIVQLLNDEPDIRIASEKLVARALEREGPDNITVVLARFDGPNLAEPGPEDLVQFVPYDPGYDHTEPRRVRTDSQEKVTVEVTVPKDAIRLTTAAQADAMANRDRRPTPKPGQGPSAVAPAPRSETGSLLTFVLLTLIAATAAGAFIKCDRSRALERESQAAPVDRANRESGPGATNSPSPSPASPTTLDPSGPTEAPPSPR